VHALCGWSGVVSVQPVVVKVMGDVRVQSVQERPPFQMKLLPLQSPRGDRWGGLGGVQLQLLYGLFVLFLRQM
jgi:hypothetical protein